MMMNEMILKVSFYFAIVIFLLLIAYSISCWIFLCKGKKSYLPTEFIKEVRLKNKIVQCEQLNCQNQATRKVYITPQLAFYICDNEKCEDFDL